jgi:hypothetical protein
MGADYLPNKKLKLFYMVQRDSDFFLLGIKLVWSRRGDGYQNPRSSRFALSFCLNSFAH